MKNSNTSPPENQPPADILAQVEASKAARLRTEADDRAKKKAAIAAAKSQPVPAPVNGTEQGVSLFGDTAQAPGGHSITGTVSATLKVTPAANDVQSIFGGLSQVDFGKGDGLVIQKAQPDTFVPYTPKDALPFDNQITPFDKLPDKPWPDPMSRELLKKVSEAFVMLTVGSSSRAYHIASGDTMSKEGFRQHCAAHVGEVVLEWKGTVLPDPKAKVTPIGGVEIVRKEERKPLGDYWWDHDLPDFGRRAVRRVIMEPNTLTAVQDARDGPEVLNLWHAYKQEMVEPIEGVTLDDPRIAIFLNQMRRYAGHASDCDDTVMFFLAGYAWIYKHPDVKLPWYTLMYSEFQGTGKSKLFKLFKRVLGEGLVSSCTGEDLNEKFTELSDHKRMVFVHEMPQAASRSATGYERFKNRTTEEYVASRQMRTGSKQIRNFTHYVISTNNLDCLPLAHKDRRALSMVDHGHPLTLTERIAWADFCDGDVGPALVAGLLANWKHPADYSPYADVPQTAGALEMQLESRSPLVALLAELIAGGKGVFAKDIGRAKDIAAELGEACAAATRRMDLSPSSVSRAARKAGAIQIGSLTNAGSRALCWRKQTYWIDVSPKAFNAYIETGTPPDDYPKTEGENHE